jgi:DHA3 family macrolide efflux protein-like MFS transporter
VLLIGALVGLVVGIAAGGRLDSFLSVRLRFLALLVAALVLRFGTAWLIESGAEIVDALRLPLYATAFALVAVVLWLNRTQPGLLLVMVGVMANGLAVVVNAGWMPYYPPALEAAGLTVADLSPASFFTALPMDIGAGFLLQAGPFGDVVPLPVPYLRNVISLGDIAISIGLGWFVLATMLRRDTDPEAGGFSLWAGSTAPPHDAALDTRPVMLGGGRGPGLMAPDQIAGADGITVAAELPAAGWLHRFRDHPYLRLLRDARFSAFWLGQAISMFGDRLHQLALGALVLATTGSYVATGLVFLMAAIPNLVLGPIAGTFVDRWDQKRVMVASDLLRALLVLLIPVVAAIDIVLVYPMALLVTTVSLFFRPARAAVVPRIVQPDDLLAANSALWTAESLADILGYPIGAAFVAFVGAELALAFWVDAATYVVSAVLIMSLVVPPVARTAATRVGSAISLFRDELVEGWRVMRSHPMLLQNTLVSAVAQICIGAMIALSLPFAEQAFGDRYMKPIEAWGLLEAFIGVGNLVGGLAVGIVGARLRKGRMVVAGIVSMGIAVTVLGLTTDLPVALVAAGAIGIANLVYVVPTQTIFGEVTPEGFLGRVVAIRSSIVVGTMTLAMALCSVIAESVQVGTIIAATGLLTLAAGLGAAALPAVRDA